jgi:uncharacterized protein
MKPAPQRVKRWLRIAAAGVLIFLMLRWFEHSQVYHPDRILTTTGAELGRPFEDVWFKTSDGAGINGWFFPAATNSARAQFAVVLCHGNAGNIGDRLDAAAALLATGVNVLLFDYRGFGRSPGRPGEEETYRDAQAAYHWLRERGFAGTNIIAFGESLGGGVAAELAVRVTVGGLVLQSTFTSIPDVGAELFPWLPVRWLAKIHYATRAKLPRLQVPVLVMHSRTDELIPFHHGQQNYAAANSPKLFWELTGSHNEAVEDRAHFTAGVEKFLRQMEAPSVKVR